MDLNDVKEGQIMLVTKTGKEYEVLGVDKNIGDILFSFLAKLSEENPLQRSGIMLQEKKKTTVKITSKR